MKKIISFLIVAALCMPAISSAQEPRGWAVGIKGGLLYGTITGNASLKIYSNYPNMYKGGFKLNSYLSGMGAVYSDYRFNDSWSLGSEVGIAVVRELSVPEVDWPTHYFAYKDHNRPMLYFIPVIVKYYIPKTKGLHLTLGPELGVNLGSRYFKLGRGLNPGGKSYEKFKYFPVTFAINSGIGYRFNFGMTLQAEYSAGLTRIVHKTSYYYEGDEARYRDGMFRFSVSYDLFKRRK